MYNDWHSLGEVQYRKWPVYESMLWDSNLRIDDFIITGASYGGPIAMVRNHRRLMISPDESTAPIQLQIYSSSGQKISEVIID